MKAAEIEALELCIRRIAETSIADHAADRMAQKTISAREIENCLRYGQAVEIHKANELRAVIRHAYGRPKVAVCVVVGLNSGTIVTTWKNAGSDGHSTLNMWAYQWNVNVATLLQEAR